MPEIDILQPLRDDWYNQATKFQPENKKLVYANFPDRYLKGKGLQHIQRLTENPPQTYRG